LYNALYFFVKTGPILETCTIVAIGFGTGYFVFKTILLTKTCVSIVHLGVFKYIGTKVKKIFTIPDNVDSTNVDTPAESMLRVDTTNVVNYNSACSQNSDNITWWKAIMNRMPFSRINKDGSASTVPAENATANVASDNAAADVASEHASENAAADVVSEHASVSEFAANSSISAGAASENLDVAYYYC